MAALEASLALLNASVGNMTKSVQRAEADAALADRLDDARRDVSAAVLALVSIDDDAGDADDDASGAAAARAARPSRRARDGRAAVRDGFLGTATARAVRRDVLALDAAAPFAAGRVANDLLRGRGPATAAAAAPASDGLAALAKACDALAARAGLAVDCAPPDRLRHRSDPHLRYCETPDALLVYDGYPKARRHLLALAPRGSPLDGVASVRKLRPKHLPALRALHAACRAAAAHLARDGLRFRVGYHARPSLEPLHAHVVSVDLVADALKTKKHFHSFATDLFVDASELELWVAEGSGTVADELSKRAAPDGLRCHRCGAAAANVPALKRHLETCAAPATRGDVLPKDDGEPPAKRLRAAAVQGLPLPESWAADGSLVVRAFGAPPPRGAKVAGFDFDNTLSDNEHFRVGSRLVLQYAHVPRVLRELHADGYALVIATNESLTHLVSKGRRDAAARQLGNKLARLEEFAELVDAPMLVCVATDKHGDGRNCHKASGGRGMWRGAASELGLPTGPPPPGSFFCGDTAGRPETASRKADYADEDERFAEANGFPAFHTETDFFERLHPA
ncbi:DNA-3'-diphospho-5'-guanosine diphosphatase [Aureococcus anophagefferens]|uniref:DNA-3'-diphospho-5'-guanosine diphosphatase n=2 Tax=Aureococcus anophagefferens TaxID=44056 RepID=A0ABR1G2X4_AURAN